MKRTTSFTDEELTKIGMSKTHSQLLSAVATEIALTMKWARARKLSDYNRCPYCGLPFYHIISHVGECEAKS